MGNLNFNAGDFEPNTNYELIPSGWYVMRIIGSEMKESKKAGVMLKLTLECDEFSHPSLRGRRAFSNLCLNHPSEAPRNIASRALSSVCLSLKLSNLENAEDLLGGALMVRLEQGAARDGYDAQNEVRGYRAIPENKAVVVAVGEKPPMRKPEPLPTHAPVPSMAPRRVEQNLSPWAKKPIPKDDEIPF